ncbi:hypothetical protein P154DRAFT_521227 [Amniculicola lignicola CBS 123094]|uniref:F-box domain-containing protein n=1 Tax=Amniculicola lignicola CBS 123094 TaxID=1392246 RepID=A0A6A5WMT7_9PLEO|nr:hypothetical protein P154DRAFT_521227 [Amniculicola lignicola CBS 123094]
MKDLMKELEGMTLNPQSTPKPFNFFGLPYELRLKVYDYLLLLPSTIDLDPSNYRTVAPKFRVFFVCHRMHEETYRVFYGRNTFRLFPIHGRFFNHKKPLLARLPPRYIAAITRLELRLGPGWNKPGRGWVVDERLQLQHAVKVRVLRIFVEMDPASTTYGMILGSWRVSPNFFTGFSVGLVRRVVAEIGSLRDVEMDTWDSLDREGSPLLDALVEEAKVSGKTVTWVPENKAVAKASSNEAVLSALRLVRVSVRE